MKKGYAKTEHTDEGTVELETGHLGRTLGPVVMTPPEAEKLAEDLLEAAKQARGPEPWKDFEKEILERRGITIPE